MSEMLSEYPRISLSQFCNNIGEVLDLATVQPIALISDGRERHIIADIEYFHQLEATAGRRLEALIGIKAIDASEMSHADRQTLLESLPSVSEIAKDHWG